MAYTPPVGMVDFDLTWSYTPPVGTVDLDIGATAAPERTATLTAYTPPVGMVDFDLTWSYTPPVGTVDLDIGATAAPERTATIAGETLAPVGAIARLRVWIGTLAGETRAPTGAISTIRGQSGAIAGETRAPTGAISTIRGKSGAIAGETRAPTGRIRTVYDPNLLSAVHALAGTRWRDGATTTQGIQDGLQEALLMQAGALDPWRDAAFSSDSVRPEWQDSPGLAGIGLDGWQEASAVRGGAEFGWQDSPRMERDRLDGWQDGERSGAGTVSRWRPDLPRPEGCGLARWQHGTHLTNGFSDGMQDGLLVVFVEIETWQQAGYPGNAQNPGPTLPPDIPWPWGTDLNLRCPLPDTMLRIGRSPCVLVAEREIPYRRSYMITNSASLVRWPDLTPLPVTSMTIETDFDSWCWALTATLAGPEAWPLVQPNPLACQVQATINGQVWRFLLDVPSTQRSFGSDRVTLKGRSRSAWLHDPYTPSRNFSETEAREMQQLGEAALANTGWALDWQGENWVVPAGRYHSWNTPIGVLIRLASTTDDGLYTHPYLEVISLIKRWPVASWLVDGETASIAIPEGAILSLTQSPIYNPPYNGVYVSGTSHGALALVKIAGTDGALQPDEPLTNELLCDEAGVAARQRGLNFLSDSGAGWEMDAETLFAPNASPAFPLVPPGQIVSIAGMKGINRSCRIGAQWTDGALVVRQSIGLERREVEAL